MSDQPSLLDADPAALRSLLEEDAALPDDQASRRRWPKDLAAIVMVVEAALQRRPGRTDFAVAAEVTLEISRYAGGRQLYIPTGRRLETALRDADIYRRARRGNIEALAQEFGLTVTAVYEIIREQRALYVKKVQPPLFTEET